MMQNTTVELPTFTDVLAAADRIGSRLVRTPVLSSPALDERVKRRVVFKCENLQHGAELLRHVHAHVVHPFDDARVIAGQGTAAMELFTKVPELDVICAPIGGAA
jgi:threonine dehydratase